LRNSAAFARHLSPSREERRMGWREIGRRNMQKMFERFTTQDAGNVVVDWMVLAAGIALMITSVALTLTGEPGTDAAAAPAQVEDYRAG
jgi:hypothetical protein